ncbi:hypothetical protein KJ682_01925 [bacterium]|nr:hypothetical protein [bacterium]
MRHTRFKTGCILIGILLLSATSAMGQSPVLDMTVWPTTAGWPQVTAGGGTAVLGGGILTLTAPVNTLSGFRAPFGLWSTAAADPGGFEIEAVMKVVSVSDPGGAAASVTYRNGVIRCIFDIYDDHIGLSSFTNWSGTTTHVMDTTDGFHQYVISGLGNQVEVTVDGVSVISAVSLDSDTGTPVMDFGDEYWTNDTTTEWSYVAFGPKGAVPARPAAWGDLKAMFR